MAYNLKKTEDGGTHKNKTKQNINGNKRRLLTLAVAQIAFDTHIAFLY